MTGAIGAKAGLGLLGPRLGWGYWGQGWAGATGAKAGLGLLGPRLGILRPKLGLLGSGWDYWGHDWG